MQESGLGISRKQKNIWNEEKKQQQQKCKQLTTSCDACMKALPPDSYLVTVFVCVSRIYMSIGIGNSSV